ncbi:hypothetical protein GCM10022408_26970 [Hymenobacter fastidiosus]|uniref:PKD/Chitinase domain-containing protein n=1 Tax=Hymenobacter fastidiosus TaxID=486264 RepID=A0ABP7SKU2_9BACT
MHPFLQRSLLLILLLLGLRTVPAAASHLLGGEISYSYLNANGPGATPYRYRVTVLVYVNAGSDSQVPDGRPFIDVAFYNKTTGARLQTVSFQRTSNPIITPPQPGGCSTPGNPVSVRLVRYETVVNLPLAFEGYYAVYTDGTRNAGILNLAQSASWSQLIYVEMAPPLLPNSSPTFSDTAVVVVCQGDTSIIVNNAVDADGDRLIYSFSRPYGVQNPQIPPQLPGTFTPPPTAVAYANGYSQTAPFGTGPGRYAFLNASNGLSAYATALLGSYVVAVEVKEYRTINGNEVLIGSTRREIQLVSRTCVPNKPPQFTAATLATRLYTVEEGQTVSFNLGATDPDGNPINLKVNSVLLDGSGPFNATFAGNQGTVQSGNPTGTVTINGTGGSVNGQFIFNSSCGTARSTPYDLVVTATDVTCGAKSVADILQIQVTKAAGPTSLAGPAVICDRTPTYAYTATGPAATSYRWTVQGGVIQGANSTLTVQVRWTTTGAGRITVKGVSALGCLSDSVSRTVDVRPVSGLAVTPTSATICEGTSTTLTASGAQSYAWTGGGQTFTGATITVSPTQTTTYTVTSTDGTCTTTRQVTVVVNPRAVAQAGTDKALCSGETTQLGSAALAGYSYSWSPATGLSNPTVANPVFVQTNTTTAPQQFTYTVTATTAQGCVATDEVTVILNQAVVAQAGPDQVFCSGGTASLGIPNSAVAGVTYLWTPAAGLSDPTAAATTVTLTNPGTTPIVTAYILRATTAQGCTATSPVRVTVNPAAVVNAGNDRAVCSGTATQLGTSVTPGYAYSWSPATNLSSATTGSPVFSALNLTPNPITTTYTVTATTPEGCTATDVVNVTVNPAAVAVAGTDRAICSGETTTLGSAALTGYSYSWSPATGLSSATVANPTFTLTNTGTTPQIYTFIVTATTAQNCPATSTVRVTVNPAAVAVAGTDRAICSGETTQLGSAALAGYSYSWSPSPGLSSTTAANPTFSLTNTGTTPQIYTFIVTATTAQGCTATSTVRITVNPAAVADAGTDGVFCSGGTASLGNAASAVAGSTYLWSPATGLSNPNILNPTVTLTNTGTTPLVVNYTLRVTTSLGCPATSTVRVTVNPASIAVAGTDRAICSGETTTLGSASLAGYSYSWSPATGLSSATVANPTFSLTNTGTTPQRYTFVVTATTAEGCPATSTVRITVNPAAVAIAGTDRAICSGETTTLGSASLAGYSYSWSPATGLSSAAVANPTFSLTNTGTTPQRYTFVVTATTAEGCTATSTVRITVNPASIAVAGADRAICSGETTTLGSASLAGYSYSWSPATGLSSAAVANPTFSLTNTGTTPQRYTFVVTATTAEGCPATSTVRITVNPAAVANAGTDAALCAGGTTTLGTTALAGYTYSWSPATSLSSSTTASPVVTALNLTQAPITTIYTVTATTAQGCVSTDEVSVTVNPTPLTDNIQGTQSVCPTVQGVAYSIKDPRSPAYRWTVVGGTIASGQGTPTITVNWNGANANARVQAYAENATLCQSAPVSLPVRINQLLQTARPTGPTGICQADGPYTYQTVLTAGSSYAWNVIGGTQVASSANTVTVQWTRPGIGKIAVFETTAPSGGRCISQTPLDTLYVNVLPSPSASLAIAGPNRACVNAGSLSFSLPGLTNSTYAYTLNGTAIAGTTGTVTLPTPAAPGTYTLTAVEKNASLCSGPVYSTQFTVVPALAVSGPASYCPETRTGLTYTVGATAAALPNANYQWSVTGGTVVSGQGTGTITLDFPAGTAAATLRVSDVNSAGCAATFTISPDNASVALQVASVAPGDRSVTLQLNVPNNTGNGNRVRILRRDAGTGTFVGVGTVANTATSFTDTSVDADARAYDYRLELQNSCGTVLQTQDHTTIRAVATATEGQAGRDEGKVKATWNAYRGFEVKEYRIFRTADNGTSQLVKTVPGTELQTEFASGTAGFDQCLRVVAVSSANASLTAASNDACVNFANDLVFYNVITPNGDGLNDKFEIKNVGLYAGNSLTILNRWGKEVYATSNYGNTWTGDEQSAGVYYYLLKLPNGKSYKGWFEIVK